MPDIIGCIITLDAMGCQKKITSQIINQGGDYVITVKGNQGNLFKGIQRWFEQASQNSFEGMDVSRHETVEGSHHRIETRECITVPIEALKGFVEWKKWVGLKSVVMIISRRKLWNKETEEVRFYISSLPSEAEKMLEIIRSHWGIENSLH